MRPQRPWFDPQRGYLLDRLTQQWVRTSGRQVMLADHPWLDGPVGRPDRIGHDFFEAFAAARGLRVGAADGTRGLMPGFDALRSGSFDPDAVQPAIRRFYERTSEYALDVSSRWSAPFRPFGVALAALFGRRLQQLNVPLSPTAAGMTSSVVVLEDPRTGHVRYTAWVRRDERSGETIYAASYSVTSLPARAGRFVKVDFPLPNGLATVLLTPTVLGDRSLLLRSRGVAFCDPGFYLVVGGPRGRAWVRYVSTFHEAIRVYVDEHSALRADHDFHIWGRRFMRLRYRLRERPAPR